MFVFVALDVSVPESLAVSRHFTVNTRAECKYYVLSYAIKSYYFVTGTSTDFEYQQAQCELSTNT